jgi:hypothetical protein
MFKVNERVKREEKEKILEVKVENVDKSSEEL